MTVKRVTYTYTHTHTLIHIPIEPCFQSSDCLVWFIVCFSLSEVTYRCRKIVDKEVIDLEILDTVNKVQRVFKSEPHRALTLYHNYATCCKAQISTWSGIMLLTTVIIDFFKKSKPKGQHNTTQSFHHCKHVLGFWLLLLQRVIIWKSDLLTVHLLFIVCFETLDFIPCW